MPNIERNWTIIHLAIVYLRPNIVLLSSGCQYFYLGTRLGMGGIPDQNTESYPTINGEQIIALCGWCFQTQIQ